MRYKFKISGFDNYLLVFKSLFDYIKKQRKIKFNKPISYKNEKISIIYEKNK